jgi:hypothetical protein
MAPPFGIYCDESVRMTNPKMDFRWYKWNKNKDKKKRLYDSLEEYFEYTDKHCYELDYDISKMKEHRKK